MEPTEPLAAKPKAISPAAKRLLDAWDQQPPEVLRERTAAENQPPVRWREIAAVLLLVVLCDATIYRGHGFAGYALLFAAAPVLFAIGSAAPDVGAKLLAHRRDVGAAGGEVALVRFGRAGGGGFCPAPGLRRGAFRALPLRVRSRRVFLANDCGRVRWADPSRAVLGQDATADRPRTVAERRAAGGCALGLRIALRAGQSRSPGLLGGKDRDILSHAARVAAAVCAGPGGNRRMGGRDLDWRRAAAAGH